MSSKNFNLKFKEILGRIKEVVGEKTDKEIGVILGVKPSTIANWPRRKSIPWSELFIFCQNKKLSFYWLLTGEEQAPKQSEKLTDNNLMDRFSKTLEENGRLKEKLERCEEKLSEYTKPWDKKERRKEKEM